VTFQEALVAHVARLQAAANAKFAADYPNLDPPTISAELLKRYARVIRTDGSQRFVVHFVEVTTGLIWKAKSWKAPARNYPRGSIYAVAP